MDRIGVRAFSSKTAAGGYGKEPARDLKVSPSSGTSESWCTVTFDDERSNGWTSPASEMLTIAGSTRSPLRTPADRYGSRGTGGTAIPFITRLFAVTPSAAAIRASIDSKRKGSNEAGAWPPSVSKAKTAPSLLSPTKRTPSGLKGGAPDDCAATCLIVFMMFSIDRPLTAALRLNEKRSRRVRPRRRKLRYTGYLTFPKVCPIWNERSSSGQMN